VLYQFYIKEKGNSRLIALLKNSLALLVDVIIPPYVPGSPRRGGNAHQHFKAVSLFEKRAGAIIRDTGLHHVNDVVLFTIKNSQR